MKVAKKLLASATEIRVMTYTLEGMDDYKKNLSKKNLDEEGMNILSVLKEEGKSRMDERSDRNNEILGGEE